MSTITLLTPLWFPLLFAISLISQSIFWGGFLSSQWCPLRKIPGPRWAAYSRIWLMRTLATGDSAKIFLDVNKAHGPLARIGPKHLLTSDAELTRRILASEARYIRAPGFDALRIDPQVANVASVRDSQRHHRLRYQLSHGYAGKGNEDPEPIIDKLLTNWLLRIDRLWSSRSDNSRSFDIGTKIRFLMVDIITRLCLGEAFGCVEHDSDQFDFLKTVQIGSAVSEQLWVMPEINRLLFQMTKIPFLRRQIVPSSKDRSGLGKVMRVIHKSVEQRFQPGATPKGGMLDSFLERGLPRIQADTEILISLVAGSDTTSTAVQSTLLAIISNPCVYRKLQQEIDQVISDRLVSRPVQQSELKNVPYFQACVWEGLRIHPPVGQLRERMVPPEGDSLLGFRVPGGTFVGFNAKATQLDEIYGDDPEVYRPERWLIEDQERVRAMHRIHELIFGHGASKCLGTQIATMEINKTVFELLRYFNVTTIDPRQPLKSTFHGIYFQTDFNVRVTRRQERDDIDMVNSLNSCI